MKGRGQQPACRIGWLPLTLRASAASCHCTKEPFVRHLEEPLVNVGQGLLVVSGFVSLCYLVSFLAGILAEPKGIGANEALWMQYSFSEGGVICAQWRRGCWGMGRMLCILA